MKFPSILATGAMLAGLIMVPVPAAAQSLSLSFGVGSPRHYDYYDDYHPRYYRFHDYRPRYRSPRARIRVDLGPFSITTGGRLGHIARCEARFRSYNHRRDSYMGFDGKWHRCRL